MNLSFQEFLFSIMLFSIRKMILKKLIGKPVFKVKSGFRFENRFGFRFENRKPDFRFSINIPNYCYHYFIIVSNNYNSAHQV